MERCPGGLSSYLPGLGILLEAPSSTATKTLDDGPLALEAEWALLWSLVICIVLLDLRHKTYHDGPRDRKCSRQPGSMIRGRVVAVAPGA